MTYTELKRLASPQLMAIYDKIEKAHLAFRNDGNKNKARKESLYFITHNNLKDPVLNAELDKIKYKLKAIEHNKEINEALENI